MREHQDVISVAAATANGFAMPYRTRRPVQPDTADAHEAKLIVRLMRNPCCAVALATLARGTSEDKS